MTATMKNLSAFLFASLLTCTGYVAAQPKDAANPDWQKEIPRVIYPDQQLVDLYEKTWAIAADRVRLGPQGLPASPYLDENCYEDQIWIWDSCFMVMFSKYAPKAFPGKETLNNLYYPIHENVKTPLRIHLRDNPPLFAWIEHDNYRFTGDYEHLKLVLQDKKFLQRHFDYFNTVAKSNKQPEISPNEILRGIVKDNKNEIIGFTWTGGASGMDNTPRGRDAGGYNKIMWIDAISQQALSALYIARLCEQSNLKTEAKDWQKRYELLKKEINNRYWDKKDGYYYDVEIATGKPCRIKTPASFWAMLAEIPSKKQAAQMVEMLKSDRFLGGDYPWVSLARDDKDYNTATGDYWRGGIWLPMAYMGTKALEKYGYTDLADKLAEKVLRQQLRTYQAVSPHTIWECYSPGKDEPSTEHGRCARPDFCGWSALGPISLFIENILGFNKVDAITSTIEWRLKPQKGTQGIKNLHFGDTVTDIVYDASTQKIKVKTNKPFTLKVNGKVHHVPAGESVI